MKCFSTLEQAAVVLDAGKVPQPSAWLELARLQADRSSTTMPSRTASQTASLTRPLREEGGHTLELTRPGDVLDRHRLTPTGQHRNLSHREPDDQEQHRRHDVVAVRDAECVVRLCLEVVERQSGHDRCDCACGAPSERRRRNDDHYENQCNVRVVDRRAHGHEQAGDCDRGNGPECTPCHSVALARLHVPVSPHRKDRKGLNAS